MDHDVMLNLRLLAQVDPIAYLITSSPRCSPTATLLMSNLRETLGDLTGKLSEENYDESFHIIAFGWTWDVHEEGLLSRTRSTMTCGGLYGRIFRTISSTPLPAYSSASLEI